MNRFLSFAATALAMVLAFAVVGCNDGGGGAVDPGNRTIDLDVKTVNSGGESDLSGANEDQLPGDTSFFCDTPGYCPVDSAGNLIKPGQNTSGSSGGGFGTPVPGTQMPPPGYTGDLGKYCDVQSMCPGDTVLSDPIPPVSKDTSGYYVVGPSNPVKPDPVTPDTGNRDPVVPTNNTAVPFTELTKDFSARCDNESARELLTRVGSGAVMIINSLEEFYSVIPCGRELDVLPPVDFATSTLLFAAGRATNGIARIEEWLSRISETEYDLTVALQLNVTDIAPVWDVGLVVDKLSPNSIVNLYVKEY